MIVLAEQVHYKIWKLLGVMLTRRVRDFATDEARIEISVRVRNRVWERVQFSKSAPRDRVVEEGNR